MPKLSIIVPVYNVEKYLSKCIDSILNQTFEDFELILIDDGSPDECGKICDNYANKDRRIIVIHQKNAGVSAARNAGLDIAKGEYIGFIDSDDYIDKTMYEKLINAIESFNVDMAICGYDYINEAGNVERKFKSSSPKTYSKSETFSAMFDMPQSIRLGLVNKLFKNNLIKNLRLPIDYHSTEDGYFLINYLENINSSVFIREGLYKNAVRTGSATHGGLSIEDLYKSYDIHEMMYKKTSKEFPELHDHAFAFFIDVCMLKYKECKARAKTLEEKEIVRKMKQYILSYRTKILFNTEIFWKTKIVYFLGKF